jgi:isopentenyl diphosphate isomerase/L-lactate dehydrogenase-like FMN-dependent dehydrogenase
MVFDFCDGGAEDEITRERNETAFADWEFLPTPLNGTSARDQSIELFGARLALPVIIGPTGLSGMLWPRGEAAAARAAVTAGIVYIVSHGSTVSIERLASEVPGRLWFQNFMYRDRGLTRSFAERAQAAGYRALVLTIDNQVLGQRERDLANGFVIPPRVTWRGVLDVARAFPWALRMARAPLTFANYASEGRKDIRSLAAYIESMLDPTLNWTDVDWLRGIWRGPLLLKGVLHPDEARLAVEHGIDGLIVSNHGGRQLDTAVPAIRATARRGRSGRRPHPRAARRRRAARQPRRQGGGAWRCRLPDRPPAPLGPDGRGRSRRRAGAGDLSARHRPGAGARRLGWHRPGRAQRARTDALGDRIPGAIRAGRAAATSSRGRRIMTRRHALQARKLGIGTSCWKPGR